MVLFKTLDPIFYQDLRAEINLIGVDIYLELRIPFVKINFDVKV